MVCGPGCIEHEFCAMSDTVEKQRHRNNENIIFVMTTYVLHYAQCLHNKTDAMQYRYCRDTRKNHIPGYTQYNIL